MTTSFAVIGAGAMGRNHARVLQSMGGVSLEAIVDPSVELAAEVARLHGGRTFASLDAMLAAGAPTAAVVAVPTQAHFATARTLLEHGVHVLVEKPIATTEEEGLALARLAAEKGLVLAVGHVERFNPAVLALKAQLDRGALGRVFQVRAQRIGPFPARIRDVGVALDLATHDLDVMRYLLGADVVRVFAEAKREVHTSNDDLVSALLRFADDTVGTLEVNWLTPTKSRELTVTGERGMFRVDYLTQDLFFFENAAAPIAASWPAMSVLRGVSEGTMTRYPIPKKEPLRAELEGFVRAIGGDRSQIVSGEDGVRALRVATALGESSRTRAVVTP
ncbi:MAG: Gfo/Idh/MocA family oxidoreductase [Sandaracinus sp.]